MLQSFLLPGSHSNDVPRNKNQSILLWSLYMHINHICRHIQKHLIMLTLQGHKDMGVNENECMKIAIYCNQSGSQTQGAQIRARMPP